MIPKLSIVIPTRNRQKYCIAAIKHILSFTNADFELCVHDNSDDAQIEAFARTRSGDIRFKYKRVSERLNSVHNMDKAVEMACGKYVVMIGDDDTVLPAIFDVVNWADSYEVDSLCSKGSIAYYWPGAYREGQNGRLEINLAKPENKDSWSFERKLDLLLREGITRFLDYSFPKLYHGLILNDRLQEIKAKTGHFLGGLSPDIYSSIALCSVVKNHKVIDTVITISGACRSSSTSQNLNNGHRGELSQAPHLILRGPYLWDNYVPAFYSAETIWAESAIKAIDEMGMTELRSKFNYSFLVAFAALNNRNIFGLVIKKSLSEENYFIKEDKLVYFKLCKSFCVVGFQYLLRRINRVFKKKCPVLVHTDVVDIAKAALIVSKELKML